MYQAANVIAIMGKVIARKRRRAPDWTTFTELPSLLV